MCGIAGIARTAHSKNNCVSPCAAMQARLRHRGPDDEGLFVDTSGSAAVAHTRLSIQDLSAAGHQPMISPDDQHVIVFNGEIYNFLELRAELVAEGEVFKSRTDTEVLLKLYARHGRDFVSRLQGMFAFAIWDVNEQSLFLARDPLGIKPLYVWRYENTIAFASEIRAVLASNIGPKRLNESGLYDFLRLGSVQEPETLVENISLLPPGHTLVWKNGVESVRTFWDLAFHGDGDSGGITNRDEAISLTRNALAASVDHHFVSDVPVGVFLSGGLDSTALVGLARAAGREKLRTFCISFDEQEFNEGSLAGRTAQHFDTQHTDVRMNAADGMSLVESYLDAMDQPCNDGFNTFCVSRIASQHDMKVVLSGLGGDELFGGYPSFRKIPQLMRLHRLSRFLPVRKTIGRLLEQSASSHRFRRLGDFLRTDGTVNNAWSTMRGFFTDHETRQLVSWLTSSPARQRDDRRRFDDAHRWENEICHINALEMKGYMLNQLLRESDVMSMASSLELRVPLVDQTLIDTVTRVHSSVRLLPGKQLLMDAVPEIPEWIRNVPKQGFRFPFEAWARGAWGRVFDGIRSSSPVPCDTWYRLWTLFVLRQFLEANQIEHTPTTGVRQLPLRRAA
jgi:asparagine synthase (glutamine-hydrolysing)